MRTTTEIMDALVAKLQAVQWTPGSGPAEPAFQEVKRFDSTELVAAFTELLVTRQRVALVVYMGDRFGDAGSGPDQVCARRTTEVSLILSDRVVGKRQDAIYGTATNPGALPLKDLVRAAVAGRLLAEPGAVLCAPVNAEILTVENLKERQPGRAACLLELECTDDHAEPFPETD